MALWCLAPGDRLTPLRRLLPRARSCVRWYCSVGRHAHAPWISGPADRRSHRRRLHHGHRPGIGAWTHADCAYQLRHQGRVHTHLPRRARARLLPVARNRPPWLTCPPTRARLSGPGAEESVCEVGLVGLVTTPILTLILLGLQAFWIVAAAISLLARAVQPSVAP